MPFQVLGAGATRLQKRNLKPTIYNLSLNFFPMHRGTKHFDFSYRFPPMIRANLADQMGKIRTIFCSDMPRKINSNSIRVYLELGHPIIFTFYGRPKKTNCRQRLYRKPLQIDFNLLEKISLSHGMHVA